MAHGYYNLQGKFVTTASKAEATDAWRKERGYSTGGVYDMGGGEVVDTRRVSREREAAPTPAASLAQTLAGGVTVSQDDSLIRATSGYGTTTPAGGTETVAEKNARLQAAFGKASTSTSTFGSTYVPAPGSDTGSTFSDLFGLKPQGSQNVLGGVSDAFTNKTYQDDRQYDLSNRYGAPQQTDIEQRQYNLPQFGTPPDGKFGLDNTLDKGQLAEAARLTGEAMFTYGQLPSVISSDVANQLPYKPTSDLFKSVMQDAFGVDGFETSDEFLTKLGYYEYEKGKWEILDPITVTGYGDGVYQSGGTSSSRGGGYSPSRGYSTGGSLVNWRIGF